MELFIPTLNQMIYLFAFILIGYLLARFGAVKSEAAGVLSKLENMLFIPALVMGTFMKNFSVDKIHDTWKLLAFSLAIEVVVLPLALWLGRIGAKDKYERNIAAYGLAFSNFGFMGNAVVSAVFPDIFMEYVIFTLVFWVIIYGWAVPAWLIPTDGKPSIKQRIKNIMNPMFIGMLVGAALGLSQLPIPGFVGNAVDTLGSCMSPVAMLLTGMTIASIDLKAAFKNVPVYIASALRLVVIPVIAMGILWLVKAPLEPALCVACALAMPLGLSPIVVPGALGKDTSDAAGMALISHLLSCLTIPIVFWLFELLF
jgi:predicted permease